MDTTEFRKIVIFGFFLEPSAGNNGGPRSLSSPICFSQEELDAHVDRTLNFLGEDFRKYGSMEILDLEDVPDALLTEHIKEAATAIRDATMQSRRAVVMTENEIIYEEPEEL